MIALKFFSMNRMSIQSIKMDFELGNGGSEMPFIPALSRNMQADLSV